MANTIQPNNNTSLYNSGGNAIPISANVVANNITATGNLTVGGFIVANGTITTDSNFVGNLVGNVDANNIETGTVTATGNISTTGFFIGDGSQLTNLPTLNYSNANVANYLPVYGGNIAANSIGAVGGISAQGNILSFSGISAAGNITGNYFFGNGSQLTGLPQSYSNANVTTLLANFGSNTISSTGNISAGAITAQGNVTGNYFFGNGSQLTGLPQSYSNANVAAYLPVYSGNIAADTISATGNVTGLNLKTSGISGNIVGANYISAQYYLGDGGLLSNIGVGAYSNANVATFLNDFGSNVISTSGNITSGNLRVTSGSNTWTVAGPRITAPAGGQWFSDAGNLDEYINSAANGYLNFNSLHANGQVATNLHLEQTIAHIDVDGSLWTFNSAGNLVLPGNASAINYANGVSILSGISSSYSNANVAAYLPTYSGNLSANIISATGNITGSNLRTAGAITATGNVTGNYFIGNGSQLTGITTSAGGSNTQIQFNDGGVFAGNANVTYDKATGNVTVGNIVTNGSIINSKDPWTSNATTNQGRISVGSGNVGNYNVDINSNGSRFQIIDNFIKTDDATRSTEFYVGVYANLNGATISNNLSRVQGSTTTLNMFNGTTAQTNPYTQRAQLVAFNAGTGTQSANIGGAGAQQNFLTVNANSTVTNFCLLINGAQLNGNVANLVGTYNQIGTTNANVTGNYVAFYMPSNASGIGGQSTGAGVRMAPGYFFLRNDDDLAKNKMGSMETLHYATANISPTTGNITINKNNGQYQQVYPTGNITVTTLSNFVTRVTKPDSTFANQTDIVTLLIQQSTTPYTVTMPTGNANIRYANGVSTVANTANSTTIVTITGSYNYNVGGTQYLIDISPEYTTV